MPTRVKTDDRRLIGTWKSDRLRTFRHYKPKPTVTLQSLRRFRSLFGKLEVQWTRSKCHSNFDGHRDSMPYEVVASDAESVVVRYRDVLTDSEVLRQITFDGNFYWIALGGGLCEWFRRIK